MSIAIITGGSRGLGKSMALHLAKKGVDIIFTYNTQVEEAEKVVQEIISLGCKACALQLNVSKSNTFAEFAGKVSTTLQEVWQIPKFDYLVNNAGIGIRASFYETTEAQFDELMNIQLKGPFFITQKLLPLIADHGKILNISTGLTRFVSPGYAAYATMKGGIEILTRYMAKELGSRGISVNTLAPGAIETDFGGGVVRDNQDMNKFLASQTALGRVGLPDDIGKIVASILTEDNQWINAQRIEASGGMFL